MLIYREANQLPFVPLWRKNLNEERAEYLFQTETMMKEMKLWSLPQLGSGTPSQGEMTKNIRRSAGGTAVPSVGIVTFHNREH